MNQPPPSRHAPSLALRVLLLAAFAAAAWLARPFADALLIAAVVAILAWPLHSRLLGVRRMRPSMATIITVLLLTVGAVGPAARGPRGKREATGGGRTHGPVRPGRALGAEHDRDQQVGIHVLHRRGQRVAPGLGRERGEEREEEGDAEP